MDDDECGEQIANCQHGECVNLHGSLKCVCEPGYAGTLCDGKQLVHLAAYMRVCVYVCVCVCVCVCARACTLEKGAFSA